MPREPDPEGSGVTYGGRKLYSRYLSSYLGLSFTVSYIRNISYPIDIATIFLYIGHFLSRGRVLSYTRKYMVHITVEPLY